MNTRCPECAAPLSPNAAGGLCPQCLIRIGLERGEATVTVPVPAGAVQGPEVRAFPCDFGGYRLRRPLGRGGMGTVYEAEQTATGRIVALKVLARAIDSPEMRRRFLREGRLAASINHPNTVYVFGTEEIEDAPVIAMELSGSGTLRDEIKRRGPMPPREAVDAILQVIAGLECAYAAGVLHRDVKPENCFVSPDGTVKVGDFGLSVSTLAREDTQITASGTMMGTPSYAPPEQLRGDELNVRADIYSTGATLYALLCGRAPFTGDNVVRVVAAVLDQAPPPLPQSLPAGLAEVVMRCMEKDRARRFGDYAALREALLPFSSAVPEPASPWMRFMAGAVDEAMHFLPIVFFVAFSGMKEEDIWPMSRSTGSFLIWLAFFIYHVAYYAIPEGRRGASAGKWLFRLRVLTPSGAKCGVRRGLWRSLPFVFAIQSSTILAACFSTAESYRAAGHAGQEIVPWWTTLILWGALFVTMRRRNGYASVMDLASGTRVVTRPVTAARPKPVAAEHNPEAPSGSGEMAGPFRVTGSDGTFNVARDDTLRRTVWIRRHAPGTPPLTAARQALGRPARLRWLQGKRTETEAWDAFEAPAGKPLRVLMGSGAPAWADLRHWLLDLTEELDSAGKDGTLPAALSMEHVWITAAGRAVLLDEPWQTDAVTAALSPPELLNAVAGTVKRRTLPVHARSLLDNLAHGSLERLAFAAGNLRSMQTRPAVLDRRRRMLSLLSAPFLIAVVVVLTSLLIKSSQEYFDGQWAALYPDRPPLPLVMRMQAASTQPELFGVRWLVNEELAAAAGRYIAGQYTQDADGSGKRALSGPLTDGERQLVAMVMAQYSRTEPAQLAADEMIVRAMLPGFREAEAGWHRVLAILLGGAALFVLAGVQAVTILVFGQTPGQKMFGFAVVDARGLPPGRRRLMARWLAGWLPSLAAAGIVLTAFIDPLPDVKMMTAPFVAAAFITAAGLLSAIIRPCQGLHDRLAGTWVVPR